MKAPATFVWRREYLLAGISFFSGAILMTFELAAARILTPSIGSSSFVWTSVIGVIIAMLALGVWLGGRLADRRHAVSDVAFILLGATLTITAMLVLYPGVLAWLPAMQLDPRLAGIIASLTLFAPTSFVLGMAGPYLAKFNVTSLERTGRSIANLDAMNALGGITGTFVTGFVLFGLLGSRTIFIVLAITLVALSWLIQPREKTMIRAVLSGALLLTIALAQTPTGAVSIDTTAAHYTIETVNYGSRTVQTIATSPSGYQSGVDMNNPDELVFWYTQELARLVATSPRKDKILILGGGTFTLPRYLAHAYPESRIDTVEIDPALSDIARRYFAYDDPPNVQLRTEDARTYVAQTTESYDIVIVDVYSGMDMPFSLITKEYGEALGRIVTRQGVVLVNIVASDSGPCADLFAATTQPYLDQFQYGAYRQYSPGTIRSNIIATFSHQPFSQHNQLYRALPRNSTASFTDNFAPVEHIQYPCTQVPTP